MSSNELRRGDLVQIKSATEILATLDEQGMLDALPFMPEMTAYCGHCFIVERRAEKLCDTIKYTGSRRLADSVLLADLRCNGAAHGGCQAECRFFWKESWLRKLPSTAAPAPSPNVITDLDALLERCSRRLKYASYVAGKSQECWSCQATELLNATQRLGTFDPRPYINEYLVGNVSLGHCVRVSARAAVEEPLRKLRLIPEVFLKGPASKAPEEAPLNLQPGELIRVKSKEEIATTLNDKGYNRGLWFDREMMQYCGGTFRVRRRVKRFIDDRDAHMVELKTDAVTLESVVCTGDLSARRWFCPRATYPYWRECWLERLEQTATLI